MGLILLFNQARIGVARIGVARIGVVSQAVARSRMLRTGAEVVLRRPTRLPAIYVLRVKRSIRVVDQPIAIARARARTWTRPQFTRVFGRRRRPQAARVVLARGSLRRRTRAVLGKVYGHATRIPPLSLSKPKALLQAVARGNLRGRLGTRAAFLKRFGYVTRRPPVALSRPRVVLQAVAWRGNIRGRLRTRAFFTRRFGYVTRIPRLTLSRSRVVLQAVKSRSDLRGRLRAKAFLRPPRRFAPAIIQRFPKAIRVVAASRRPARAHPLPRADFLYVFGRRRRPQAVRVVLAGRGPRPRTRVFLRRPRRFVAVVVGTVRKAIRVVLARTRARLHTSAFRIIPWLAGKPPSRWFLDPRYRIVRATRTYRVIQKRDERVYSGRRTFRVISARTFKVFSGVRTFKLILKQNK